jgi:hypothetical protein
MQSLSADLGLAFKSGEVILCIGIVLRLFSKHD